MVIAKGEQGSIKTQMQLPDMVKSPVKKGDVLGEIIYTKDDAELGRVKALAGENVERVTVWYAFCELVKEFFKV